MYLLGPKLPPYQTPPPTTMHRLTTPDWPTVEMLFSCQFSGRFQVNPPHPPVVWSPTTCKTGDHPRAPYCSPRARCPQCRSPRELIPRRMPGTPAAGRTANPSTPVHPPKRRRVQAPCPMLPGPRGDAWPAQDTGHRRKKVHAAVPDSWPPEDRGLHRY